MRLQRSKLTVSASSHFCLAHHTLIYFTCTTFIVLYFYIITPIVQYFSAISEPSQIISRDIMFSKTKSKTLKGLKFCSVCEWSFLIWRKPKVSSPPLQEYNTQKCNFLGTDFNELPFSLTWQNKIG